MSAVAQTIFLHRWSETCETRGEERNDFDRKRKCGNWKCQNGRLLVLHEGNIKFTYGPLKQYVTLHGGDSRQCHQMTHGEGGSQPKCHVTFLNEISHPTREGLRDNMTKCTYMSHGEGGGVKLAEKVSRVI